MTAAGGRPLAEKFEEFASKSTPPETLPVLRDLMRMFFYTGALALDASLREAMDIGLEQMLVIHQELVEFRASCAALAERPEGGLN